MDGVLCGVPLEENMEEVPEIDSKYILVFPPVGWCIYTDVYTLTHRSAAAAAEGDRARSLFRRRRRWV